MAVRWMLRRTHNTCFAAKDDVRFAGEYVGQLLGVGRHLAIIGAVNRFCTAAHNATRPFAEIYTLSDR